MIPRKYSPWNYRCGGSLSGSLSAAVRCYLLLGLMFSTTLAADPRQDLMQLRQFYRERFPTLTMQDYADGVYALDPVARESWLAIEEFPPYEPFIERGEAAFTRPFKNGRSYADCFPGRGIGIAHTYPKWDSRKGEVITLAIAINQCRTANGEEPPLTAMESEAKAVSPR